MDKPGNIIDAAHFFSLEVFPKLRKRYSEGTLELVGTCPTLEVNELGKIPGITYSNRSSAFSD